MNIPQGIVPFAVADPWDNCHLNFQNTFAKNASWQPTHSGVNDDSLAYKRATENLKWAIGEAIDNKHTLRAIGANWSLSKVAMCNGGMLQTKGLDLIFNFRKNTDFISPGYLKSGKTIDGLRLVECGTQIARLNKVLEIETNPARCIKASGGSNGQTIAGATSTGTHGAALYTGAVHDAIVGMHLITGRSGSVWLERASYPVATDKFINWLGATAYRDDDLFNAAVVSFGSFGIIHGVVIETEPLFLLREYRVDNFVYSDELMQAFAALDILKLRTLLPTIPESKPGHELYHMEINMNPYAVAKGKAGGMFVFLFYKVPVPSGFVVKQGGDIPAGPSPEFIWMMKDLLGILGKGGNIGKDIIKKTVGDEFNKNVRPPTVGDKTIGTIFRDTRFTGNIGSFALAIATNTLPKALEQIIAEVSANPFAGAVAVRFVKGTPATLGFTKFEHTCVIEMDGLDSAGNHKAFANVVERLKNNSIPYTLHWGKLNDPLDAKRVLECYGADKLKSWKQSREKLLSPETRAVFTNEFMIKCGLDTPADVIV